GDEFIIVRDTALSDARVQGIINGSHYVITDCCGFLKTNETAKWQPYINIGIANGKQLAIVVDLDSRKVTGLEQMDFSTSGPRENNIPEVEENSSILTNTSIYATIGIGGAAAVAAIVG